ncbi:hypothetical protein EVAR_48862_1 [Eumeta japonica]|uniref:Uncharacterized protein n=1 Tax=Eumeta variegata TaxID=151549 RepID=A0A4C1Y8M8_EUMVA|nr:hypothetical protein EVAR_48862_1 [Eumeta japonica]
MQIRIPTPLHRGSAISTERSERVHAAGGADTADAIDSAARDRDEWKEFLTTMNRCNNKYLNDIPRAEASGGRGQRPTYGHRRSLGAARGTCTITERYLSRTQRDAITTRHKPTLAAAGHGLDWFRRARRGSAAPPPSRRRSGSLDRDRLFFFFYENIRE